MVLPEEMTSVAFLRDLGQPYLAKVAAMARLKEYGEGTVLFSEGEVSPVIYFVLSGEVRLVTDQIGLHLGQHCAGSKILVASIGKLQATACGRGGEGAADGDVGGEMTAEPILAKRQQVSKVLHLS